MQKLSLLLMAVVEAQKLSCKASQLYEEFLSFTDSPLWGYEEDLYHACLAEDYINSATESLNDAKDDLFESIKEELWNAVKPGKKIYQIELANEKVRPFLMNATVKQSLHQDDELIEDDELYDRTLAEMEAKMPHMHEAEAMLKYIVTEEFPCLACESDIATTEQIWVFLDLVEKAANIFMEEING